jgi:hypothetical protein
VVVHRQPHRCVRVCPPGAVAQHRCGERRNAEEDYANASAQIVLAQFQA